MLADSLRRLLRRGATTHVQRIVAKSRPEDIAQVVADLATWEGKRLFGSLSDDPEALADIISNLDEALVPVYLPPLGVEVVASVLKHMATDDRVDILGSLDESFSEQVLKLLPEEALEPVEELLGYADDTAGGIMDPDFFALDQATLVAEAVEAVRTTEAESVFYLYCVDAEGLLVGVCSLRELLLAPRDASLKDIARSEVLHVSVDTDQEEVARMVAHYDLVAVPVVDQFHHMVGIVTVDDVIDVLREEATEDIMKMVGAGDDLLGKSPWASVRSRSPWLFGAVLGGLAAGLVIKTLGERIEDFTLVAAFIPIVAGLAGNAGVQSSTMIVRGLATGRLSEGLRGAVLGRELQSGLLIALTAGAVIGLASLPFSELDWLVALVVGVALFQAIFLAVVIGVFVPVLFNRLGVDPALATGPVLTALVDLVGIGVYLALAVGLLPSV
jgi:magnesium transporter